ncbi:hypothetical protein [Hyphomonas sp.]|uniref:hypothetical protein n=2 Tax=Hyphomonas sp. TaxID=87 RepID=UPI00329A2E43
MPLPPKPRIELLMLLDHGPSYAHALTGVPGDTEEDGDRKERALIARNVRNSALGKTKISWPTLERLFRLVGKLRNISDEEISRDLDKLRAIPDQETDVRFNWISCADILSKEPQKNEALSAVISHELWVNEEVNSADNLADRAAKLALSDTAKTIIGRDLIKKYRSSKDEDMQARYVCGLVMLTLLQLFSGFFYFARFGSDDLDRCDYLLQGGSEANPIINWHSELKRVTGASRWTDLERFYPKNFAINGDKNESNEKKFFRYRKGDQRHSMEKVANILTQIASSEEPILRTLNHDDLIALETGYQLALLFGNISTYLKEVECEVSSPELFEAYGVLLRATRQRMEKPAQPG